MRWVTFLLICASMCLVPGCDRKATGTSEPDPAAAFESPYFTVEVTGSGPDVILVPGLGSSSAIWDGTVGALGDQFRFHIVQVSGFAGAPARGNADNDNILDDVARDLAVYSGKFDTPPGLVGHSLGGLVSIKTALDPDASLDRLVIVDVLPFFSVLMDTNATATGMAPISALMKSQLLAQSDELFARRQAEALDSLVKDEDDLRLTLSWSVASDRAVMAQAMSEVLVTDLRSQVSAISIPTTVIFAMDDTIPDMPRVETFYRDLYAPMPDVSLVPIENALHFVMLDQPEAFWTHLQSALSE